MSYSQRIAAFFAMQRVAKVASSLGVALLLVSVIAFLGPAPASAEDRKLPEEISEMRAGWRVKAGAIGVVASFCTAGPQVSWIEREGENTRVVNGMVWPEHCAYIGHGEAKVASDIVSDISSARPWKRSILGEVVYRNNQTDLSLVRYTHEDDEGDLTPYKGSPEIMTNTVLRGISAKPVFQTYFSRWNTNIPEHFSSGEKMCWTGAVTDVRCGNLSGPFYMEGMRDEGLYYGIENSELRCAKEGDSGAPVWQASGSGHLRLGGMQIMLSGTCTTVFRDWEFIDTWVTSELGAESEFQYLYAGSNM